MKITMRFEGKMDLRVPEGATEDAIRKGLRTTILAVHADAVRNSPVSAQWPSIAKDERRPTGMNRRSITAEVSGLGRVAGTDTEHIVDDQKLEAAVYGTSGYGGYLETGTRGVNEDGAWAWRMPPRPYIRPAMDRHGKGLPDNIRAAMPK